MNLLAEFGVSVAEDREYSITFLDGILACPRKIFLSRILRLPGKDDSEARTLGSAGHAALHELNKMRKDNCLPCEVCPNHCKITTPAWVDGIREPSSSCAIAMIAEAHFKSFFTETFIQAVVDKYTAKGHPAKGLTIISKFHGIFTKIVKEALHATVNSRIVLAEEELKGTVGPFKVHGYPDLVEEEVDENGVVDLILSDYKFRKNKPSEKDFPGRQLFLYASMLQSMGIPITKVRVIYIVLSATGTVIQQTVDIRANKATFEKTLEILQEDMYDAKEILTSGNFHRNRQHRFHPCEMAEYCENRAKTFEVFEQVKEKADHYDRQEDRDECDDSDA